MKLPMLPLAALFILAHAATLSAQTYPVPLVNTPLVPSAVTPGSRGFTLKVNGNGFISASRVFWNGAPRKTTFLSNTLLTASIPASDIATASTAIVTVANPGKNHTSNSAYLQVSAPEQTITMNTIDTGLTTNADPLALDLNGDGIADLIMQQAFEVDIALGLGGGNFAAPQRIPFALPVHSMITGVFLNSGKPDIVVVSDSIYMLANNGSGFFATPRKVLPGRLSVLSLAAADVNGDGLLDLVEADSNGYVHIYLRKAGSLFQPAITYAAGSSPYSVAIGDLNGDGFADLAVLTLDDTIAILLGNGDGTFQPATLYSEGQNGDFPIPVILGDLNGDGKLDVARAAGYDLAGTGVALGNGDGTLQPMQIYQTSSYGLVAGDFNSDGILDVATGLNAGGTGILVGKGDGTFQTLYNFDPYPDRAYGVAAADFDNNGRLDVAAAVYDGTTETVKLYVQ